MKILEIINLPQSAINLIGGQFSYLHTIGGFEMHLICSPGEKIESFCEKHGVHYYPIQMYRHVKLIDDLKALWRICSYIRKNKIDIVIAHQVKGRLLGMIASNLCGVKYKIIFAHGVVYETMTGLKRALMILNDKFVSAMADKVICVSNYVVEQRKIDNIDKEGKCIILGNGSCNGVDTINKFNPDLVEKSDISLIKKKYGIDDDDFVIGFCGRLVCDKGVVELITAYDYLKSKCTNRKIRLFVIGPEEKWDALPAEIIYRLNTDKSIIFTGRVPFEEIHKYYMVMNVLVLPTHREGFGLVSVEAQAMTIPAIVSNYTGCAETVIDGVTGLYIDKTPESIVKALTKMLDLKYAKKLGIQGRKFVVENFEHTIIRSCMLNVLNSMIER